MRACVVWWLRVQAGSAVCVFTSRQTCHPTRAWKERRRRRGKAHSLFYSNIVCPLLLPSTTMTDPFYADMYAADGSLKMFINGEWKTSTSGKTVNIGNPTTEAVAFRVQGAFCGDACPCQVAAPPGSMRQRGGSPNAGASVLGTAVAEAGARAQSQTRWRSSAFSRHDSKTAAGTEGR